MPRYRKRYSKSRRVLSKVNIAANRNAKQQSKQIAALSRKLNYITKQNKPEIRIKFVNFTETLTNSALAQNFRQLVTLSPWSNTYTGDDAATTQNELEGNFNRNKGISLKAVVEYTNDFTGDESDNQLAASYCILIVQEKIPKLPTESGVTTYSIGDIFDLANSTTSADTNITMPLVSGITARFKILFSKCYTIHKFRPTRLHNIYIPGNKCLNYIREKNLSSSSPSAKGRVYAFILSGGLHADTTHVSKISIAGTLKLAYTDN